MSTMESSKSLWAVVLFMLGVSLMLAFQESESGPQTPEIRAQVVTSAAELKSMESVDLPFPGVEMLCIQAPHLSKGEFERSANRDIEDFKRMGADTQFRLHVFSRDGKHEQLLFDDKLTRINYVQLHRTCEKTDSIHLERRDEFVLVSLP